MILGRRNRTIIDLLGNVFIHYAARSRLSTKMAKACKERILNSLGFIIAIFTNCARGLHCSFSELHCAIVDGNRVYKPHISTDAYKGIYLYISLKYKLPYLGFRTAETLKEFERINVFKTEKVFKSSMLPQFQIRLRGYFI